MATKLSPKAYRAYLQIQDTSYKNRVANLEMLGEFGFAFILYWNQIESAVKLARYGFDVSVWPDKLDFLNANWGPLKRLKADNNTYYESVFGKGSKSLRIQRNAIVHEGALPSDLDYQRYIVLSRWAIENLQKEVPKREKLIEKKRRMESNQ
jgi:hypothetical protein